MLVLYLLFSIVFLSYLKFHWSRRRLYQLTSQVQGPKPWPIVGNLLEIIGDPANGFKSVMKLCDSHAGIFTFWFGPIPIYGIHKPEYLEVVLNNQNALAKSYFYRFMEPLLGWGLITAPVPIWKRHRKIIAPTFNNRILEAGIDTINEESIVLVEELLRKAGNGFFDVNPYTQKCTFDIFCGTSMGIRTRTQTNESSLHSNIKKLNEIIGLRVCNPSYYFDFTYDLSQLKRDSAPLIQEFEQFTEQLVQERKQVFGMNIEANKKRIFVDMLLEASNCAENKLSDIEIRDEVNTFVLASSDTTSQTCSFLMVLLGMYPEVQKKIYLELLQVIGEEDSPMWEHLSKLKYTEKVIKETLRLFPPVNFLVRDITSEIPLGDGIILANGSSILINIIHVHRNAKYWPDPLNFDPERFNPEEIANRHPYSYLPFSGGPRNCIGMKYAMMTLKIMVACLVRKIKISTKYSNVEEIRLRQNIMPIDGHMIAVEKR